jgi:hypothetical protein
VSNWLKLSEQEGRNVLGVLTQLALVNEDGTGKATLTLTGSQQAQVSG